MLAKQLDARDVYESRGVDAALRYLSRLPRMLARLGAEEVIAKGASALNNPEFYRELGQDPDALIAAARAATRRLCFPPPVSEETTVPTPNSSTAPAAAADVKAPAKPKAAAAAKAKPKAEIKFDDAGRRITLRAPQVLLLTALKAAKDGQLTRTKLAEKCPGVGLSEHLGTLGEGKNKYTVSLTEQKMVTQKAAEGDNGRADIVVTITKKGLDALAKLA